MKDFNKVNLVVKYCDEICEAIDEDSRLFDKRIALVCNGKYGSQEFQKIEYQLEQTQKKIKDLAAQAAKVA